MVTKKTSTEDVKKVSSLAEPKAGAKKGKTTATTSAKKTLTRKESAVKVVGAKVEKAPKTGKVTAKKETAIPETPSQDVVSTVLEKKAKNEAKKSKKAVKTVDYELVTDETKDASAANIKSKRNTVKENAQKAEAKKFIDMKGEALEQTECSKKCCFLTGVKNLFGAWIDAYKRVFDYKSRTNRYTFWAFMLVNMFFTFLLAIPYQRANINALFAGKLLNPAYVWGYWIFIVIEMFVYLALYVRRLHDTGEGGWKGYFRPMTYSILTILALIVVAERLDVDANSAYGLKEALLGIVLIVLLFINLYYLFKTIIAVSFIEEDNEDNAYGIASTLSACQKKTFLRCATLYIILTFIYMTTVWALVYFMSFSVMLR